MPILHRRPGTQRPAVIVGGVRGPDGIDEEEPGRGRQRHNRRPVLGGSDIGHDSHAQRHIGPAGDGESDAADLVIARLVRHGVVLRADLLAAGVGEGAIDHRVRQRRLHPFMGGGAYLVGHPDPPPLAREFAALCVGGPDAAVSDRSAAVLWGLLDELPGRPVHLTLDAQRRNTDTLTFHRRTLLPHERGTLHGDIRVTSPARTIADIAPDLADDDLERIVADAVRRRLVTMPQLEGHARLSRPGMPRLRRVLQLDGGPAWTRSKAEREFLALVRLAGLPTPRMNRRRAGKGRDAVWDRPRVVAEVDGFGFHGDRFAFENDRARDAERAAHGWLTLRFTWRQIRDRPLEVAARLSAVLSARS